MAELEAAIRARTRRRAVRRVPAALGGGHRDRRGARRPRPGRAGRHRRRAARRHRRRRRPRRHHLGPCEEALREIGLLRFAARRLAERDDTAALSALTATAGRLDRLLLAPPRPVIGDRELVIAPTGALHGLPWAVLPSLAGRPHAIVPSAGAWLHARTRAPSGGHTVLVAGPDLHHAGGEIASLHRLHPEAVVLDGDGARAETVRDALDGAALAHIAAHGEFREGNALFSRLRLADGPLLVHDLDELAAPPRLVVLSACDIGRADGGDAVLGMAGVLLALGTATVIASVTPVRDEATPAFMTAFHASLAAGLSPARALAAIPRAPATAGFLAMGAG
ncbi:CHAT domain-containing protein [Actinomadura madurae]|uniref:CHAT domain-containing protein n=1 Tax=Actinomadura madurae TaxID=1993 RepID=UPI0020D2093C|nr:CHAT domain-containing protein [Actinomadura madurae]MCP9966156.1 CHAT domain-containing protein [Actinomadura madurae]MCP9978647.1 CHAT domain-containing protein [Actinomadura madurae]